MVNLEEFLLVVVAAVFGFVCLKKRVIFRH